MPAKILMLRNQLAAAEAALNTLMQTRSTLQTRDAELEARLAAADAEDPELQREIEENDTATTENEAAITEGQAKVDDLRSQITELETRNAGAIGAPVGGRRGDAQARAAQFQRTGRQTIENLPAFIRANPLLVSDGNVATPTEVGGINGPVGPQVSTLIDLIPVIDCTGMGTYREAFELDDEAATAAAEGAASGELTLNYDYVDFTPTGWPVTAYISNQVAKQSPLAYEASVHNKVRVAMRKALAKAAVEKIVGSELCQKLKISASGIDHTTLSKLILSYGGDEGVAGSAVLTLCKTDLQAFAAVRGKNEYLPVYTVIPDTANPNAGILKDNHGLSCRYVLDSNVKPLTGATAGDQTMFYGNPNCAKLTMWGGFEVKVYEGYKVKERLLTIAGDLTADVGPCVKNGFVVVEAE